MGKKYGFLSSSVDPQSLSLTVKGILLGVVPAVIFVAPLLGFNLNQEDLTNLVDAIEKLVFWGASGVSVCMVVYGGIRKIINGLK